ncbi:MAG: ATP-dependent helicase [Methanomassiliicoccaceae archaeon]|nr:ATP-dependent helicase [Methanomassiliicoccaceae archaeon]
MIERSDKVYTKEEVMGVMEPLISTWFEERFDGLTEPQAKAIPLIHQKKNVLVSSPTGSGKTLTAFTSIINELTKYARAGTLEERIYCIYISPLKALANDVNRNLNEPLNQMAKVAIDHGFEPPGIRVAVRSGDTPQNERQKMARHPPHILITTPESLALIISAPKFRESLKKVEWVILDEIHDICDSKRGAFLSLTLERLKNWCETDFSRIGLSATLAPMEAIAGYLVGNNPDGSIRDVTIVESDSKKQLDLRVICPATDMTALSSEMVNSMMYDQLKELIDTHETTLVFTNTRSGAESVVYKLKERGLENIEVHHSSLGRETRLDVEERLKRGEIKCVVSSTSLELGIDIGSVDLVCQIGSPKSVAKGLQRIGRSGHSFGQVAKGRLLVFDSDDLVECAVMCRAAHRGDIDRVGIPENCLDVLAQAIVGMSLDNRWDVDEAFRLVKGSYCYRNLTREEFLSDIRYLGSRDDFEGVYSKIWYDEGENQFGRKKGARMIYYLNLGTIPEEANYKVITGHGSMAGELSEKFVERLSPRDIFVLGGRSFEFVRSKGMTAFVKEATGRKPTVPSWAGEMLPRSFDLSMDIAEFRKEMSERLDSDTASLISSMSEDLDIDEGSARSILSYFREQKAVAGFIPDSEKLAIEEYMDPSGNQRLVFHFPFGRRVNDALSRGYAYRLTNILGTNVSVTVSDDNFMIGTSRKVDIAKIPGMLKARDLEQILRKAIKDSEIFKLRFRHTASRSFMILRNYMGRSISVNRQQIRSSYLLEELGNMENMPVIEETYREIMEDDMDIRNAEHVLKLIEGGNVKIETVLFTGTPSPFAHSAIISSFSDIVLMEDRSALLRELHRKVLYRALGDAVKEFEFDEDHIIPYFREKIGRIQTKDDIVPMLMRTGPLQALRERGRNIYSYSDEDKKTVDKWIRELFSEGKIGSVFMDDPYVMAAEEVQYYAVATVKEREMTDTDIKVLEEVSRDTPINQISESLEISEDIVYRSIRKLEAMYRVARTAITGNGKWLYSKADNTSMDRNSAVDRIIMRHLECFAPATSAEIAFALSLTDEDAHASLESLLSSGDVAKGRFLISEGDQYMLKIDRMRLRAGKENIYSFEAVEEYRASKGREFSNIVDYFKFYGSAGSEIDVFSRVKDFKLKDWQEMRESGRILLGRFMRGRVRYVLSEDADRFAALRSDETQPGDEKVLNMIDGMGTATLRQLVGAMRMDKDAIKEAVYRLDRSLRIVRAFGEREDWGTENTYLVYRPGTAEGDPLTELAKQTVRAYGPLPAQALRYTLGIAPEDAKRLMDEIGASQIIVGDSQTQMFVFDDEIEALGRIHGHEAKIRLCTPFDPDISSKWAELSARYGDSWVYPLVRGSSVVGAVEMWEMSGCIEIRSFDLDSEELIPAALASIDDIMLFFKMKNTDIVRIREVMGKDAALLAPNVEKMMEEAGYLMVNGFYAKGDFVEYSMTDDEFLSYVFEKQRVGGNDRYPTVMNAVISRGYIRGDQEIYTRVLDKTTIKKQLERGYLVKTALYPAFIGYTTKESAQLYRAAKSEEIEGDEKMILSMISNHSPISRKEIVSGSPLSQSRTVDALSALSKLSVIHQDSDSYYSIIPMPKISREEAIKEIARRHFSDFGIFSAENLSRFMSARMSEVRSTLAALEREGLLKKGFFIKDDPTLIWILSSDVGKKQNIHKEIFALNTQDNLHFYIRQHIKAEIGQSRAVIFEGTKISGSFDGKLSYAGSKVENFKGSDRAKKFLGDTARSLGISMEDGKSVEQEDDWDAVEFYLKSNPGAVTRK